MIGVIDSVNSEAFEFCISVLSRNVPTLISIEEETGRWISIPTLNTFL